MSKLTAETITDEQIHWLHREHFITVFEAAWALGIRYPTHVDRKPTPEQRREVRARCARILNARASGKGQP